MLRSKIRYLGVLLISLILVGCSNKDYGLDAKNPITVSIWHYYNGTQKEFLDEKVDEFNDTIGKEKGIIVEAYNQGGNIGDLTQKVMDSIDQVVGAEELPDAFAAYGDTAYDISQMGIVTDISKYLSKAELDEYIDAYVEEGRFGKENEIMLFPIAKSTEVLVLNRTDWANFEQATNTSIDELSTWEGIVRTAKAYYEWTDSLTDTPNDGKALFGRDAMANYMIIGSLQLGHEIFKVENGNVTYDFDKNVMRKLWDNYYVPYINGYFASRGKFRSDDVKTGDIIASVVSTSGITYFPASVAKEDGSTYEIDSDIFPVPGFEGYEPHAVQQGAGMVVMKSEEAREYATICFLKWFTETQNNVEFSISSGYLPVKSEANKESEIEKVIENSGEIPEILQEALFAGIQMTQNYQLYTSKAFANAYSARSVLDTALESKAKEDYGSVQSLMEAGVSREEAVASFTTDENFNNWYEETKASLLSAGE